MNIVQELQKRGFVHQFTGSSLEEIFDGGQKVIYHGIDPSADSAHAGNFASWMLLHHLAKAGHKIIFLVGGGTGRIGDPKPDVERSLKSYEEIDNNVAKLKLQAESLFQGYDITFVNNHGWLGELKLIEFLRDVGKQFTVNELIKKDAIATRLQSEHGLSYTEFAYPLLQGFDYLELFKRYACTVQVGGSDQWGNMVAGVDLIRRMEKATVHVLTIPLVVDKTTGKKFGKSEGNAVWLDAEKTPPYAFYQFWYNTSDENVADYLKLFTTLPLVFIDNLLAEHNKQPEQRIAQKHLADSVTAFVHGIEAAEAVSLASTMLFADQEMVNLTTEQKQLLSDFAPLIIVEKKVSVVDALVLSGLASSKREARQFIVDGAVFLQYEKVIDDTAMVDGAVGDLLHIRRGKKQVALLQVR